MSDFWVRKMKTIFDVVDVDKDYTLTKKDFELVAEKWIDTGKLTGAKADEQRKNLRDLWDTLFKPMTNAQGILTPDNWLAVCKNLLENPEEVRKVYTGFLPYYFQVMDSDQDGFISKDDYKKFFIVHGIDTNFVGPSFKAMNTAKNGKLSLQEFINAGVENHLSQDKASVYRYFWGPVAS